MSRAEFAREAGLSYRTVLDFENGARDHVQEKTLILISKALGVSCEFLLTGRDGSERWWRRWVGALVSGPLRLPTPVLTAWVVGIVALTAAGLALTDRRWTQSVVPMTPAHIRAQRHFLEGVNNLDRLYRDAARRDLRLALADDSTFAMAAVMLVHPEISGDQAERDSLLTLARRHVDTLGRRERKYLDAFSAWSNRDLKGAIAACEDLVEVHPREAEGYRLLGRFYEADEKPVSAISALETAVSLDPRDGMSFNRLAYLYTARGDTAQAMNASLRYLEIAPTEANPYDTRGDLLAWGNRPDEAIRSYQNALARNPEFFPSMQSLGCVLTLQGRYREAERYFQMMLRVQDRGARSRARWFLGMVDIYRGRFRDAEAKLQQAIAADEIDQHRNTGYLEKLCAIARLQCALGDTPAGVTTYRAALDTLQRYMPDGIAEWPVEYVCLLSKIDIDAAEAYRDSLALRIQGRRSDLSHVLTACDGWIQLRRGNPDAACASFEKALERLHVFQFCYPLGLAYLDAGRPEDAVRVFEHCVNRYSSDRIRSAIWGVKLYYQLARAYDAVGRHQDAAHMYTRFLNIWGDQNLPSVEEIATARAQLAAVNPGN